MLSYLNEKEDEENPKMFHVKKIDNGFIVETCGHDKESTEFVKRLAQVPSVIARLMGEKGKKSASEIMKEYGKKETETEITIKRK